MRDTRFRQESRRRRPATGRRRSSDADPAYSPAVERSTPRGTPKQAQQAQQAATFFGQAVQAAAAEEAQAQAVAQYRGVSRHRWVGWLWLW